MGTKEVLRLLQPLILTCQLGTSATSDYLLQIGSDYMTDTEMQAIIEMMMSILSMVFTRLLQGEFIIVVQVQGARMEEFVISPSSGTPELVM